MLSPITLIPLHIDINVIVLSKILELRLALTKNGDPYYLAKETENKIKTQEDVTNTQEEGLKTKKNAKSPLNFLPPVFCPIFFCKMLFSPP